MRPTPATITTIVAVVTHTAHVGALGPTYTPAASTPHRSQRLGQLRVVRRFPAAEGPQEEQGGIGYGGGDVLEEPDRGHVGLVQVVQDHEQTVVGGRHVQRRDDAVEEAEAARADPGVGIAGVAVVRTGRWSGWARPTVLLCGLAVFLIVLPGVFGPFVAGRLALTAWMVLFGALGVALMRYPGEQTRAV